MSRNSILLSIIIKISFKALSSGAGTGVQSHFGIADDELCVIKEADQAVCGMELQSRNTTFDKKWFTGLRGASFVESSNHYGSGIQLKDGSFAGILVENIMGNYLQGNKIIPVDVAGERVVSMGVLGDASTKDFGVG